MNLSNIQAGALRQVAVCLMWLFCLCNFSTFFKKGRNVFKFTYLKFWYSGIIFFSFYFLSYILGITFFVLYLKWRTNLINSIKNLVLLDFFINYNLCIPYSLEGVFIISLNLLFLFSVNAVFLNRFHMFASVCSVAPPYISMEPTVCPLFSAFCAKVWVIIVIFERCCIFLKSGFNSSNSSDVPTRRVRGS
jgi:hypothetical protein